MGMGAIFGAVGTLLGRLSAEKSAYLNALNLGGSYKVASEEHWTDLRAGYISDMKNQLPAGGAVIASSTEVAKAAVWSQELATLLGQLKKPPMLKPIAIGQSGALVASAGLIDDVIGFSNGIDGPFVIPGGLGQNINTDGQMGFRFKFRNATSGDTKLAWFDVVNEPSMKGYLYGALCMLTYNIAGVVQDLYLRITVDGIVIYNNYNSNVPSSTNFQYGMLPIGMAAQVGANTTYPIAGIAPIPMRIESSLRVEMSYNHATRTQPYSYVSSCVYLLD